MMSVGLVGFILSTQSINPQVTPREDWTFPFLHPAIARRDISPDEHYVSSGVD
jgi:hypothetical protein